MLGVFTGTVLYILAIEYMSLQSTTEVPISKRCFSQRAAVISTMFAIILTRLFSFLTHNFFPSDMANYSLSYYISDLINADFFNVVLVVVAAPLLEEILFRRILLCYIYDKKFLSHKYSLFIAVLISSFLFSISHSMDYSVINLLNRFMFGILSSGLYIKTGKLQYPVILHGATNLLAYLLP